MKKAALLVSFSLLVACGGALSDPIDARDCDSQLATAFASKCSGGITADCRKLDPKFANCQHFERSEVTACVANVNNAASCESAQQIVCSLHCTNY